MLGSTAKVRGAQVFDLAAGKQLLLGRLRLEPLNSTGLLLSDCAGSVRVDECALRGSNILPGAAIQLCDDVSLVNCIAVGSDGTDAFDFLVDGAHGVDSLFSRVAITSCSFRGGAGAVHDTGTGFVYGDGGDGLHVKSGFAWVSASECEGGPGSSNGNPGRGVQSSGDAQLQDNVLLGGAAGSYRLVPGTARTLAGPVFEADGVSTIRVSGKPGDRVALFWSTTPDFRYLRRQRGVLLSAPPFAFADEGWVIDASGELEFTWTPPAPPPGEGRVLHLQVRIDRGGAVPRLSNIASMLIVDWP